MHDEEIHTVHAALLDLGRDRLHVAVRIFLAWAAQPVDRKVAKTELRRVQLRVLAGEDDRRLGADFGKRIRDGCELDRFGPGANDQPNVYAIQSSP